MVSPVLFSSRVKVRLLSVLPFFLAVRRRRKTFSPSCHIFSTSTEEEGDLWSFLPYFSSSAEEGGDMWSVLSYFL